MAGNDILYVRNCRPNATLIRVGTSGTGSVPMVYTLERRGSREDTVALPGEFRNEPVVARFLHSGMIEEISKEQFLNLGVRLSSDNNYHVKERAASEVNVPMADESSRTPTVIADADITKGAELRTPRPEFSHPIRTTEEDLAELQARREQEAAEKSPGRVDLPEGETDSLKAQVNELTLLVRQLLEERAEQAKAQDVPTEKAPKARKATTTKAKSTRASSARNKS